jgi:glutamyl-tRNA reductase
MDLHQISDPTEACQQDWQPDSDSCHHATASAIALYRDGLEKVQTVELKRLYDRLPKLNEDSKLEIRQFADRLLAKMLDPPLETLRYESSNGSHHALLEAFQRLFHLRD